MMNGAKKSDSSKVPAKLANKAERSAAESVEGDDGTKRNAELQSTVRTQSREAVTQAQARIRGAVTRNKKEKLTALLHHVSIDVLRWAFFNLKKRAAPGADGLTWADYAADLGSICGLSSARRLLRSIHTLYDPAIGHQLGDIESSG
jgi:RNA-directed DNA polymerase